MLSDELYIKFIGELQKRAPEKTKLTKALVDLLHLEKEAIYRRLRREVPFTFYEISKIAAKFNISIDTILRLDTYRPFELNIIEYNDPFEASYIALEQYVAFISTARKDPNSEIAETSNRLPLSLYGKYDNLSKYFLFRWSNQFRTSQFVHYRNTKLSDNLKNIYHTYSNEVKRIANYTFIWDSDIFRYLYNEITFFRNINFITDNDIKLIKADVLKLIDDVEQIAKDGKFIETKTNVSFYISEINFETDYSYLKIFDNYICFIRAFILNSVTSTEKSVYEKTKKWVNALKNLSVKISETGEMHRIMFFKKQRDLINKL